MPEMTTLEVKIIDAPEVMKALVQEFIHTNGLLNDKILELQCENKKLKIELNAERDRKPDSLNDATHRAVHEARAGVWDTAADFVEHRLHHVYDPSNMSNPQRDCNACQIIGYMRDRASAFRAEAAKYGKQP